jgi:hypothetical protein
MLTIFIALIVAVTITYFVNDLYNTPYQLTQSQKLFYSQKFEPEQKKIFLIGSSQVHRINATIVENQISQTYQDYKIYNLGIGADKTSERIVHLPEMIESKPVLVVYGITFRDLKDFDKIQTPIVDVIGTNKPIEVLPEPWIFLYDWIPNNIKIDFSNFDNPQITTIKIFEMLTDLINVNDTQSYLANTPFEKYFPGRNKIKDENSLRKDLQERMAKGTLFSGYDSGADDINTKDLKKIISELKKNDIEVILFSTPFSRIYLDKIDNTDIEIFEDALQKISDEFDVKIYHFYDKYADMNVWLDISHVSSNQNASIYSTDIADIILNEINP